MRGRRAQALLALVALFASLVSPFGALAAQASSLQFSVDGGEGAMRLEPGPPYREIDSGLWPSLSDPLALEPYHLSVPSSEAASPGEPDSRAERVGQTIALPFDFSLSPSVPPPPAPALPIDFSLSPLAAPPPAPPARPLSRDIPLSLLTVDVTGPDVASLGSPPGYGEVYTAVIRNDSTDIAYGLYLTATHPSFFIHDGGDQLISRTGTIIMIGAASLLLLALSRRGDKHSDGEEG